VVCACCDKLTMISTGRQGARPVIDPNLQKVMEKRDEALREAEQWQAWIEAYIELSGYPSAELQRRRYRRVCGFGCRRSLEGQ
jgi:hypothetical protein